MYNFEPWKPNKSTPSPSGCRTWAHVLRSCGGIFDFEGKKARLEALRKELEDPGVWSDGKRAQDLGKEGKALEAIVRTLEATATALRDSAELFQIGRASCRERV